ncbi:uncharacterized protein ATNIH1004_007751 [Aspergillus tanneri]|uniref:Uncharacterized protein n=1 Tax=Aspergillus tanneri TaxID=1220188 RepID=A0A5M9MLL1_9EURO|nr:uncharacterized protein ATNIH1004_007751 [Aspergillus tanneri]KAA8646324.1 hypothetical protein ATNIH1004_007751 [Aspergillus tanneri]
MSARVDSTAPHVGANASPPKEFTFRSTIALIGAFISLFCTLGFQNAFGVFQEFYHATILRDHSEFNIAWIGTLLTFIIFAFAAPAGVLVDRPSSGGYIRSVESFEPKVDFTIKAGHEWFCVDADKKFGRLSISAIAADTEGQAEVITDVNRMRVETVHEPYKPLEGMMFASSQHFVNDEKMGNMIAELRLSRFIPDSGYQQHTLKSRKILEQWLLPSRRAEA